MTERVDMQRMGGLTSHPFTAKEIRVVRRVVLECDDRGQTTLIVTNPALDWPDESATALELTVAHTVALRQALGIGE
ncbi:MAG: hypothetical protein ACJ789_14925 [Thermomicrobiales bacterium]